MCINKIVCLIVLIATGVATCNDPDIQYSLHADVAQFTSHSLDVRKLLPKGYKKIEQHINNGQLLIKVIDAAEKCRFLGIDLNSSVITFDLPDPSNSYIGSSFDLKGDSLISLSVYEPKKVFTISLGKGAVDSIEFSTSTSMAPGPILSSDKQLFLISDPYGAGVFNWASRHVLYFRANNGSFTINPQASMVSLPVNDTLNVLTGLAIKDSIILQAVRSNNDVEWTSVIPDHFNNYKIDFLSIGDVFIIKDNHLLYALYKSNGSLKWKVPTDLFVNKLLAWNEYIIECRLVRNNTKAFKLISRIIDTEKGRVLLKAEFDGVGDPNIAVCNDLLFISDETRIRIMHIPDGVMKLDNLFDTKYRNSYAFDMLSDTKTGMHYLKSYDDVFYW